MSEKDLKKIALLTWAKGENYGTSLQCYALQKTIGAEYDCSVIDIPLVSEPVWKKLLRNPVKTGAIILRRKINLFLGKVPLAYEGQKERHANFVRFRNTHFNLSEPYDSKKKLAKLNDEYDSFVCGSDQIWNPFLFDARYFLDFVSDNKKKIAYAPSFGTEHIDSSENEAKIIPLVRDFAFLSCREESGAAWLSEKTGRNVPCVLDPTLLLQKSEWLKIANENYPRPAHYIFCYFLGKNERYLSAVFDFAKKNALEVVLIPIYKKDFSRKCVVPRDIGPCEFLSLVEHADFVCTDSFHGCCFSVLFEKPFAPFLRFSATDKKSQNARVQDFLKKLGLEKLLYSKDNDLAKIFASPIDFSSVNAILEAERKKSLSYLFDALSIAISGAAGGSDE